MLGINILEFLVCIAISIIIGLIGSLIFISYTEEFNKAIEKLAKEIVDKTK